MLLPEPETRAQVVQAPLPLGEANRALERYRSQCREYLTKRKPRPPGRESAKSEPSTLSAGFASTFHWA